MKYKDLFDLITNSNKIFITSHFSPDLDSTGSALFLYSVLKNNFPAKEVRVSVEGPLPSNFSFLKGFDEIVNKPILESTKEFQPDLYIMLDGNHYKRFSKYDLMDLEKFLLDNGIKTVIIDHHEPTGASVSNLFINELCASTTEQLYLIFKDDFGLTLTKYEMDMVMVGIIADTGRFLYEKPNYCTTFKVVAELIHEGISIEALQAKTDVLTMSHALIISELLRNISQTAKYNYSFLTEDFVKENIVGKVDTSTYVSAYHVFMDLYIRNITPPNWGFIIVPDMDVADIAAGKYKGSFRGVSGIVDTTVFANLMNGGGHKTASGFRLNASSYKEALEIVHTTIKNNLDEAIKNR